MMLRYMLLAGAAALVIPGVGLAQNTGSQPPPGDNSASSVMNAPGAVNTPADQGVGPDQTQASPGYYTGDQGSNLPPDQSAPGAYTGTNVPTNPPPNSQGDINNGVQPGYYTGSQGTNVPPPSSDSGMTQPPTSGASQYQAQPQDQSSTGSTGTQGSTAQSSTSDAQQQAANNLLNSDQPVVVAPKLDVSSREFVVRTSLADQFAIDAAQIAINRTQSDQVRQFANNVIQQHAQSASNLAQAAQQADMRQPQRLDWTHRAMLQTLRRTPAADFDRVYMNQQIVAQMNQTALQKGYAANGDNSALAQVAQQNLAVAQQNVNQAWAMTDTTTRMAAIRNNEQVQVADAQNANRGTTYRGYTVIGPTNASELPAPTDQSGATGVSGAQQSPGSGSGDQSPPAGAQSSPGTPSGTSGAPAATPGQPSNSPGSTPSWSTPNTSSPPNNSSSSPGYYTSPGAPQPNYNQPSTPQATPGYTPPSSAPPNYSTPVTPSTPQSYNVPSPRPDSDSEEVSSAPEVSGATFASTAGMSPGEITNGWGSNGLEGTATGGPLVYDPWPGHVF